MESLEEQLSEIRARWPAYTRSAERYLNDHLDDFVEELAAAFKRRDYWFCPEPHVVEFKYVLKFPDLSWQPALNCAKIFEKIKEQLVERDPIFNNAQALVGTDWEKIEVSLKVRAIPKFGEPPRPNSEILEQLTNLNNWRYSKESASYEALVNSENVEELAAELRRKIPNFNVRVDGIKLFISLFP